MLCRIARSSPEVFCQISQNSQDNTCFGVSLLIKIQAWGLLQTIASELLFWKNPQNSQQDTCHVVMWSCCLGLCLKLYLERYTIWQIFSFGFHLQTSPGIYYDSSYSKKRTARKRAVVKKSLLIHLGHLKTVMNNDHDFSANKLKIIYWNYKSNFELIPYNFEFYISLYINSFRWSQQKLKSSEKILGVRTKRLCFQAPLDFFRNR